MRSHLRFLLVPLLFCLFSTALFPQRVTTIEEIRKNPQSFDTESVEVKGIVTQYIHSKTSTSHYILRDDHGAVIKVTTAAAEPETYKKYVVSGIVYLDAKTGDPYISEGTRTQQQEPVEESDADSVTAVETSSSDYSVIYILLAVLALVIGIFIYLNVKKSAKEPVMESPLREPSAIRSFSPVAPDSDSGPKTIKMPPAPPKTMKFIPGKLIITDGDDKGTYFNIAGFPTPEGAIITIGREEISGDRAYCHIQLKQKTISRRQAELIYKDNRLFVRNLSDTNFTQIDGMELKPGEKTEVKIGSKIRTGEVEFQYSM